MQNEFSNLKKHFLENEYSFLNKEQRQAVFNINGALLILAGAGSGKTTVLVQRIAYLIKYGNAYYSEKTPFVLTDNEINLLKNENSNKEEIRELIADNPQKAWTILAITFTNKAANEMKERLIKLLGKDGQDVWASTFHSCCVRILRREIEKIGYNKDFTIYDTDDSLKLIKESLKQLKIDEKKIPPKAILSNISKAKDEMITPTYYKKLYVHDYRLNIIANVYELYQRRLKEANALDFDDIILHTVKLLEENADVLDYYQNRFRYVLVDEYQDTNKLQYKLVSLLAAKNGNICVVGDDDQSIYKFRGATIENILSFEQQFKSVKVIRLEQNYRSVQTILDAANKVISNNTERKGKNLWTANGQGEKIIVHRAFNQDDEGRYIAKTIKDLVINEQYDYNDFAILYRTNAQNRSLSDALTNNQIPNRVIGGTRFYDRKEIKDMLAYLSVIANPNDSVRLKRIINVPSKKIGATTVENTQIVADSLGISIFETINNANEYPLLSRASSSLLNFCNMINKLRILADELPLNELYEELIDLSGYVKMLQDENTSEANDRLENIMELSSSIIEYMKKSDEPTLSGFLEEVSLVADIDNLDSSAKAVNLMTLHSAKGLEFSVVFIAGAEENIFPSGQCFANPNEIEEERRLAYVGITRAKKQLYLLSAQERTLYGMTQRNRISRFVSEIPSHLKEESGIKFNNKNTSWDISSNENYFEGATKPKTPFGMDKKTPASQNKFNSGDTVEHKVFGKGLIISSNPMGNDTLLEIAFQKSGTKRVMANFAALKKVESGKW